jgi:hypothetical protein
MMEKLEKQVPVLICKMEKIFPPGFINITQHYLVHLPYEAKVGGPVQYQWMYHIERALKKLRAMVSNKARVEGCIVEAFALKEIAYFSSTFFAEEHNVFAPTMRYHIDSETPCRNLKYLGGKERLLVGVVDMRFHKKNGSHVCYTCAQTLRRWNNILSECFFFLSHIHMTCFLELS